MSCGRVLLCIFLPPLAVLDRGCGTIIIVSLLTLFGWVPGAIAAIILGQEPQRPVVVVYHGEPPYPNAPPPPFLPSKKPSPASDILIVIIIGALFAACVLGLCATIFGANWETTKSNPTPVTTPAAPAVTTVNKIYNSQEAFTSMIESFKDSYNSADTEIQKTNLRYNRKDAITKYFSGSGDLRFQGWLGEIRSLTTVTGDGRAYIEIKLHDSGIIIETGNGLIEPDTMIARDNSMYQSLANVKEGNQVTASGTFIPTENKGIDYDYIEEASMTEKGSMTEPEFIVKFDQITITPQIQTNTDTNAVPVTPQNTVPTNSPPAEEPVAPPSPPVEIDNYHGTTETNFAKDWVFVDGVKLDGIMAVNPAPGAQVSILYSGGGKGVSANKLPQGFLDIWKITPQVLQAADSQ
jgi:uncharacterized membrane protein YqaE (UPF0057 family)